MEDIRYYSVTSEHYAITFPLSLIAFIPEVWIFVVMEVVWWMGVDYKPYAHTQIFWLYTLWDIN